MRKSVAEVFEDTLNGFLSAALEAMLGPMVRDEVYSVMSRNGISMKDVPARFDDVVTLLGETFGILGARVIVYKAIVELHQEYSQSTEISFSGTLRDKLLSLRERVVSNHIWPRHSEDADSFFDKGGYSASGSDGKAAWAGLYRYKRGVGSNPNPSW